MSFHSENVLTSASVKEGINIHDSAGRVLGAANYRQASIPIQHLVTRLADSKLRQEFLDLWERETGTTLNDVLYQGPANVPLGNVSRTITAHAYPKTFYRGKGHGLPINVAGMGEAKKRDNIRTSQFPYKPADIGWFIHKLLLAKYPNGGEVELGSPDVWPEDQSFWTKLRTFIEEPLYTNLPYRDTLVAACDAIKTVGQAGQGAGKKDPGLQIVRAMARLIGAIRDPYSEKPVEKKSKKLRRSKLVLTIGTTVPQGAIANVKEPDLEAIEITVTVEGQGDQAGDDDDGNNDDDNNEDGQEESEQYEATPFEIEQQKTMLAHFADLQREGAGAQSDSPQKDVEMVEETQRSDTDTQAKQAAASLKRKAPGGGSDRESMRVVKMRYGDARYKFTDIALLNWSQKYGWNLKQVEDDEKVEVEMDGDEYEKYERELGGESSRKRSKVMPPPDAGTDDTADLDDDVMLLEW